MKSARFVKYSIRGIWVFIVDKTGKNAKLLFSAEVDCTQIQKQTPVSILRSRKYFDGIWIQGKPLCRATAAHKLHLLSRHLIESVSLHSLRWTNLFLTLIGLWCTAWRAGGKCTVCSRSLQSAESVFKKPREVHTRQSVGIRNGIVYPLIIN